MVEVKPQLSLLTDQDESSEHVENVLVNILIRHLVGPLRYWLILPDCELHQFCQEEMYGRHPQLVDGVHVSLVVRVLQEQLDVVEVHVLGRHMDGSVEELLVEMSGAGSGLQQS